MIDAHCHGAWFTAQGALAVHRNTLCAVSTYAEMAAWDEDVCAVGIQADNAAPLSHVI